MFIVSLSWLLVVLTSFFFFLMQPKCIKLFLQMCVYILNEYMRGRNCARCVHVQTGINARTLYIRCHKIFYMIIHTCNTYYWVAYTNKLYNKLPFLCFMLACFIISAVFFHCSFIVFNGACTSACLYTHKCLAHSWNDRMDWSLKTHMKECWPGNPIGWWTPILRMRAIMRWVQLSPEQGVIAVTEMPASSWSLKWREASFGTSLRMSIRFCTKTICQLAI